MEMVVTEELRGASKYGREMVAREEAADLWKRVERQLGLTASHLS